VIVVCIPLTRHCKMALSHYRRQASRLFSLSSARALAAAVPWCQCLVTNHPSRIAIQRRNVSDSHDGQQKVREQSSILQYKGNGADHNVNFSCFPCTWRRLISPPTTSCRRFASTADPMDEDAESSITRRKNARNTLST
jgi:hypothetical protein